MGLLPKQNNPNFNIVYLMVLMVYVELKYVELSFPVSHPVRLCTQLRNIFNENNYSISSKKYGLLNRFENHDIKCISCMYFKTGCMDACFCYRRCNSQSHCCFSLKVWYENCFVRSSLWNWLHYFDDWDILGTCL